MDVVKLFSRDTAIEWPLSCVVDGGGGRRWTTESKKKIKHSLSVSGALNRCKLLVFLL